MKLQIAIAVALMVVIPGSRAAQAAVSTATELSALEIACNDLKMGDHDYKGHRLKALHHVEAACKLLGATLKGNVHDRVPQNQSDADLKGAQTQLQAVHNAAVANGQTELQKRVDNALSEIALALSIK